MVDRALIVEDYEAVQRDAQFPFKMENPFSSA